MPTGKRASMREGPLAALFRKTAEDTAPGAPGTRDADAPAPEQAAVEQEHTEEPAAPSAPEHVSAPEPVSAFEEPEPEPHSVPSPQERLRHVFSADIPEN